MTDQNSFMETVKSVAEIVHTSETPMSEEEILSYFEDMELDSSQKQLVLEYILNPEEPEASEDAGGQSKVFQMYLEELALLPKYSKQETDSLYEKLLQGDSEVIDMISTAWLERVLTVAKKYIEPKLNAEDLVQEGNMALLLKLQELCGSRETQDMEGVLLKAVEEGILSYVSTVRGQREMEDTVLGKVSLVHEAEKLLAEELGRKPDMLELAEYTKLSPEELEEISDLIMEGL